MEEIHFHYEVCPRCKTSWESECDDTPCPEPVTEEILCIVCLVVEAASLDPNDPRSYDVARFIIEDAAAEGRSVESYLGKGTN